MQSGPLLKFEISELFDAIKKGDIDTIKYLVNEKEIDLNQEFEDGYALIWAVESNQNKVIEVLVNEFGVDPNKGTNDYGMIPLEIAVSAGQLETFDTLLRLGANPKAKLFNNGMNLLHRAARADHSGLITKLVHLGVDIEGIYEDELSTPLIEAAECGHIDAIVTLISLKADLNHTPEYGYSPLSIAILNKRYDAVKLLVELGADIDAESAEGTPENIIYIRKDNEAYKALQAGLAARKYRTVNSRLPNEDSQDFVVEFLRAQLLHTQNQLNTANLQINNQMAVYEQNLKLLNMNHVMKQQIADLKFENTILMQSNSTLNQAYPQMVYGTCSATNMTGFTPSYLSNIHHNKMELSNPISVISSTQKLKRTYSSHRQT